MCVFQNACRMHAECYIMLQNVTEWAYMQLHKLAWSYISLHAGPCRSKDTWAIYFIYHNSIELYFSCDRTLFKNDSKKGGLGLFGQIVWWLQILSYDSENMKKIAVSNKYYFYWRVMYMYLLSYYLKREILTIQT